MQFIRYQHGSSTAWGVQRDEEIHMLSGRVDSPGLERFGEPSYRRSVRRAIERGAVPTVSLDAVKPLAPVPEPGAIVCVGLNYHDHATEQDEEIPDKPLLFTKAPTCVTNPGDPIVHPADVEQVDYEVELGVVIGTDARSVDAADVDEHVAGYTVLNDVSARDAQFDDGQFFRGKSYETFAPMGPSLAAGDGFDPNDVDVRLRVNGETKQSSDTSEFIFDVGEVVEYISEVTTLRAGDVISTGTPGGVGIFRDPPDLLEPGDVVEAEVDGIGVLRNPVVAQNR
jgi:2-keto-4-pentenoate hydratase/2-oxohepta-3-ene-1,7-dioic acid hydratase in catechol pathway